MQKTSINLPEGLWKRFRIRALEEGREAQVIVAELIGEYLRRVSKKGGKLTAGILFAMFLAATGAAEGPRSAYERMLVREAVDHSELHTCEVVASIEFHYDVERNLSDLEYRTRQSTRDLDAHLRGEAVPERAPAPESSFENKHTHDCDAARATWKEDTKWLTEHDPPKGIKPLNPAHSEGSFCECAKLLPAKERERLPEECKKSKPKKGGKS